MRIWSLDSTKHVRINIVFGDLWGIGKTLMGTAELIAAAHNFKKISVIAGVGDEGCLEMLGRIDFADEDWDTSGFCDYSNRWEHIWWFAK